MNSLIMRNVNPNKTRNFMNTRRYKTNKGQKQIT